MAWGCSRHRGAVFGTGASVATDWPCCLGQAAQKSDDELEEIEALRKSGFLKEAGEGSALQAKAKLEAKAGDRRIKRTIVFLTPGGERATRTLIYSDKDKVTSLWRVCHLSCSAESAHGLPLHPSCASELSSTVSDPACWHALKELG